jgi:hypothetical protein
MVAGLVLPSVAWWWFGTLRPVILSAALLGVAVVALVKTRAYGVAAGIVLGTFLSVGVWSFVAATPMP